VAERRRVPRRRRFGQHFLRDPAVIERIVDAINPGEAVPIVEIGPGRGALTVPLLRRTGHLDAVEIDRDLGADLEARCRGIGKLRLHLCDALEFDFASAAPGPVKVVGNLPYNISTPLLFHLLSQAPPVTSMIFMLQEEVVDRICAAPGTSDYGRLSVMVQAACAVEKLFRVGAAAFAPPPKVGSAIVSLTPGAGRYPHPADPARFGRIVALAFQQRRKMLRNALKAEVNEEAWEKLGIDPKRRAGELSVEEFAKLASPSFWMRSIRNPVD
jgi:16S rRNA (adenine1518-N6/adenine1519-N6)-dimethyltransferase